MLNLSLRNNEITMKLLITDILGCCDKAKVNGDAEKLYSNFLSSMHVQACGHTVSLNGCRLFNSL